MSKTTTLSWHYSGLFTISLCLWYEEHLVCLVRDGTQRPILCYSRKGRPVIGKQDSGNAFLPEPTFLFSSRRQVLRDCRVGFLGAGAFLACLFHARASVLRVEFSWHALSRLSDTAVNLCVHERVRMHALTAAGVFWCLCLLHYSFGPNEHHPCKKTKTNQIRLNQIQFVHRGRHFFGLL